MPREGTGPSSEMETGLIVSLPSEPQGDWYWWLVAEDGLGPMQVYRPGAPAPWDNAAGQRVTALVPAALAPVRSKPMPAMPIAQALAAERLAIAGEGLGGEKHVAVAAQDAATLLSAVVAPELMDSWLAQCAVVGLDPQVLLPAALVLPPVPAEGEVWAALLGDQPLARTGHAAFAGEPALVEALAGAKATLHQVAGEALDAALLAVHAEPPLNLRQGQYAPRRVAIFLLPDWVRLARMAAVAALLALVLMLVWTVKWNLDATVQEEAALALARQRYPEATDIDTAERLVNADLARRGIGPGGFSASAGALLAAMRPLSSVNLRDLGYNADGTLRFTAAAPRPDEINQLLTVLQRDGWKVTVPPSLAPDPTGATVAAITVRAP